MTEKNKIAIVNSSSFGKMFDAHLARVGKLGPVDRFDFDGEIPGKERRHRQHHHRQHDQQQHRHTQIASSEVSQVAASAVE